MSCRRCKRAAKASARLRERAERALLKLRDTAAHHGWRLPKLRRAIAAQRKRLALGRDRWQAVVKAVFGTSTVDLVDPRQMVLFAATEASCQASHSPNPSQSG